MVQIHSPRPSPVEPILYRHANRRRPPGVGRTRRSSVQIEALRLRYFPFSHRLTLRLRDVRNRRKLSNLSNTCLTTSPRDKESGYSEVRSGWRMCFGELRLLTSSNYKIWVEHSSLDRMLAKRKSKSALQHVD